MSKVINLLSVDFDYWYIGLNHDGTLHCGRCFKRTDRPLYPDDRFSPPQIDILDVLNLITSGTPVYLSESHADIFLLLKELGGPFNIHNIDCHSDSVYHSDKPLRCCNWVTYSQNEDLINCYRHVRSKNEFKLIPVPDIVYICKSSPYLLEKGDSPFFQFVLKAEKRSGVRAEIIGFGADEIRLGLRKEYGYNSNP